jgi:hypothetical protein
MKKMILVVYGNPLEGKYLKYEPKLCVGCGGKNFKVDLSPYKKVILFGTCGALYRTVPLGEFVIEEHPEDILHSKFIQVEHPVHAKREADDIRFNAWKELVAVEMENWRVRRECERQGVPMEIIKFPSDYCDHKAMPMGINHFWRKYNLRHMQRKFDEYMAKNQ